MEQIIATPNEAAEMLRISKNTLNNLLNMGEIPAFKEGTHWKIPVRLLNLYAESRAIEEARERKKINGDMLIDWGENNEV